MFSIPPADLYRRYPDRRSSPAPELATIATPMDKTHGGSPLRGVDASDPQAWLRWARTSCGSVANASGSSAHGSSPAWWELETVQRWLEASTTAACMPPSEGEDAFLAALLGEIGFDAHPHVVSAAELDAYIAQGDRELFRGVTDVVHADAFRFGALYAGTGSGGNGIYCTLRSRRSYAETKATADGVVLRMALKKDTRIVRDDALDLAMGDELDSIKKRLDVEVTNALCRRPAVASLERKTRLELLLFTDPGRYAAFKRYDAILLEGREMMIVLNRGALRVEASRP